jgi:hypothetical protein
VVGHTPDPFGAQPPADAGFNGFGGEDAGFSNFGGGAQADPFAGQGYEEMGDSAKDVFGGGESSEFP